MEPFHWAVGEESVDITAQSHPAQPLVEAYGRTVFVDDVEYRVQ